MKSALMMYIKKPQTILAIVVALMAQLIFCLCWMTAYDGVLERTPNLTIAIVNEDGLFGASIAQQLQSKLPFETIEMTEKDAIEALELRTVHLIVTIPEKFGQYLQTPGAKTEISYIINDSNPQVTKSAMQSVVMTLTNELNRNDSVNNIESNLQIIHPIEGMHNQMVPMMLVLASYVGAMLMAMNVQQVSMAIGSLVSKWQHFAVRAILNVIGAFVVSIVGSSLITGLGGQMASGFGIYWLFHFLTVLTFMFFAQMFLLILGMAGMFVNMAMLSLQLVTSGTIVPREMLSSFYQWLGQFLPATYAVEGFMNLGFGGIHTQKDVVILIVFLLCTVGVGLLVYALKKQERSLKAVNRIKSTNIAAN